MRSVIGLHGPSRSGKDEIARILVRDFGFEQRAQAAAIRTILLGLNPWVTLRATNAKVPLVQLFQDVGQDWDKVKTASNESVDYMIRLGQTCRDVIGLDVWMNTVMPPVGDTAKIVISDVRQPNEYQAVKDRGGAMWKITRPGAEYLGMDGLLNGYEFDAQIDNRGSLGDLRGIVQATIATGMANDRLNISHRVTL